MFQRVRFFLASAVLMSCGVVLSQALAQETVVDVPAQTGATPPSEAGSPQAADPPQDKPEAKDKPEVNDKPEPKAHAPQTEPKKSEKKTDPGQGDLDEAVIKRIDAETLQQLEAVAALLKSSLAKGLSEENRSFAEKMLGSVLLQRGQELAAAMVQTQGRRQLQMRDDAIDSLNEAVKYDSQLVEAYLMIARLNLMQGGNRDAILDATTKAIGLLGDNPRELSAAYVLRALTQTDTDKKLEDLDAAVKADGDNLEAMQARAAMRLQSGDVDGAVKDLESLLTKDPTNQAVAQAAVQQLVEMNRTDDALELITKTLKAKPSEGLYRMRAILYRMADKEDEALADLNKALAMQPKDPVSLLQRAEISLSRGDVKAAKTDLKAAIQIAPQVAEADQAIFVRCLIAIEEKRMADAINDMKLLVSRDPENSVRQLQLANLYLQDDRPRQAIETLSDVLDRDPKNMSVLRSRADAWLSVGDHAAAIKDYERVLSATPKGEPQDSGVLNNLAWVLATSPQDGIRDGKRSVQLGEKAAKLTDYKEAHILSTLAAGYAEQGDFEQAIQWSTKSVELGTAEENPQLEQLKLELESYKKGEPWREKQEVEENKVPILAPEDLIDT